MRALICAEDSRNKALNHVPGSLVDVGRRLQFDVFDPNGRLILLRGRLIVSPEMASEIRNFGMFNLPNREQQLVFLSVNILANRLALVFQDIKSGVESGNLSRRIIGLAKELAVLSNANPDAAFASIHLNNYHGYLVVHSMMAAIVANRLALASNLQPDARISLMSAALTHDLGLLPVESLINSREYLDDAERQRVRHHVVDGIALLKRYGVSDSLWLDAVRDHHEFLDGSGYSGKTQSDLCVNARIMSLADSYSAMLRPRPYRDRLLAQRALEALYAEGTVRYDASLTEALIWDFGFYPPGSLVRLCNKEMAVAIRNSPGILDRPLVASLTDSQGHLLLKPVVRDSNDPKYAITEPLDPALGARAGNLLADCWKQCW